MFKHSCGLSIDNWLDHTIHDRIPTVHLLTQILLRLLSGMLAWHTVLKTPNYPEGREVVFIANDVTVQSGSFGVKEDDFFYKVSDLMWCFNAMVDVVYCCDVLHVCEFMQFLD